MGLRFREHTFIGTLLQLAIVTGLLDQVQRQLRELVVGNWPCCSRISILKHTQKNGRWVRRVVPADSFMMTVFALAHSTDHGQDIDIAACVKIERLRTTGTSLRFFLEMEEI